MAVSGKSWTSRRAGPAAVVKFHVTGDASAMALAEVAAVEIWAV